MNIIVVDPVYVHSEMVEALYNRSKAFTIFYTKSYGYLSGKATTFTGGITQTSNRSDLTIDESTLLIPCTEEAVNFVDNHYGNVKRNDRSYLETTTSFPSVVKPKHSFGGAEGVYFVQNQGELDNLKLDLSEYIIVPYYTGTEYSVDLICKDDKVYCTGIFEYVKDKDYSTLRKEIKLVNNSTLQAKIFNFVKSKILDLKYGTGAYHIEVIINGGNINLVEINSRFHGHVTNTWYELGTGLSPYNAYIDVIIENKTIPEMYQVKTDILKLLVNLPHKITSANIEKNMPRNLSSVVFNIDHPSPYGNDVFGPTTNVLTCYSYFLLADVHNSLKNDLEIINNWCNTLSSMPKYTE